MRILTPGYSSEVDTVDEYGWSQILLEFDDSNVYQTWPYARVLSGQQNMSHLVVRRNGSIVAAAQARIAKLPLINTGVAYVRWGPIWRRTATETNEETFRQAIRALRNEFVCKRGLMLRLFPYLATDDGPLYSTILREEGFQLLDKEAPNRTILMDLSAPLANLRDGMKPHWKRELKIAERNELEVVEGSEQALFEAFIKIYKEMVSRKKFVEPNDINQFRSIQAQLPENLKMRIMLCKSAEGVCSGLICSAIGKSAVYLFGATSDAGMKSRGSYLLQWKLIERLKQSGVTTYNLNGINPAKNPGTYKFKNDLGGNNSKDVQFVGRFDSQASPLSYRFLEYSDKLRKGYRVLRQSITSGRGVNLLTKKARQGNRV